MERKDLNSHTRVLHNFVVFNKRPLGKAFKHRIILKIYPSKQFKVKIRTAEKEILQSASIK